MRNRITRTALVAAATMAVLAACGGAGPTAAPADEPTQEAKVERTFEGADPSLVAEALGCADTYSAPTPDPDDALTDAEYLERYGIERVKEGEVGYGERTGSCTLDGAVLEISTYPTQQGGDQVVVWARAVGAGFYVRPKFIVSEKGAVVSTDDGAVAETAAERLGAATVVRVDPAQG